MLVHLVLRELEVRLAARAESPCMLHNHRLGDRFLTRNGAYMPAWVKPPLDCVGPAADLGALVQQGLFSEMAVGRAKRPEQPDPQTAELPGPRSRPLRNGA